MFSKAKVHVTVSPIVYGSPERRGRTVLLRQRTGRLGLGGSRGEHREDSGDHGHEKQGAHASAFHARSSTTPGRSVHGLPVWGTVTARRGANLDHVRARVAHSPDSYSPSSRRSPQAAWCAEQWPATFA